MPGTNGWLSALRSLAAVAGGSNAKERRAPTADGRNSALAALRSALSSEAACIPDTAAHRREGGKWWEHVSEPCDGRARTSSTTWLTSLAVICAAYLSMVCVDVVVVCRECAHDFTRAPVLCMWSNILL